MIKDQKNVTTESSSYLLGLSLVAFMYKNKAPSTFNLRFKRCGHDQDMIGSTVAISAYWWLVEMAHQSILAQGFLGYESPHWIDVLAAIYFYKYSIGWNVWVWAYFRHTHFYIIHICFYQIFYIAYILDFSYLYIYIQEIFHKYFALYCIYSILIVYYIF